MPNQFDTLTYVKRLETAGVPVAQAEVHAQVLNDALREAVVHPRDLQALESSMHGRSDMEAITFNRKLDAMATDITTLKTQFVQVDERFNAVDERFNAVDERFNAIDARFNAIDARFAAVDARFDKIDVRFDAMDVRFDAMDRRFDKMDRQFAASDARHTASDVRMEEIFGVIKENNALVKGELVLLKWMAASALAFSVTGLSLSAALMFRLLPLVPLLPR